MSGWKIRWRKAGRKERWKYWLLPFWRGFPRQFWCHRPSRPPDPWGPRWWRPAFWPFRATCRGWRSCPPRTAPSWGRCPRLRSRKWPHLVERKLTITSISFLGPWPYSRVIQTGRNLSNLNWRNTHSFLWDGSPQLLSYLHRSKHLITVHCSESKYSVVSRHKLRTMDFLALLGY